MQDCQILALGQLEQCVHAKCLSLLLACFGHMISHNRRGCLCIYYIVECLRKTLCTADTKPRRHQLNLAKPQVVMIHLQVKYIAPFILEYVGFSWCW